MKEHKPVTRRALGMPGVWLASGWRPARRASTISR